MTSIRITIETDGAAFHSCDPKCRARRIEIERILWVMAQEFGDTGTCNPPRDSNGKPCGTVEVIKEPAADAS